jgi:hypothetical protein
MSASDNLSKELFHGTRAKIHGTHILPNRGGAWATDSLEAAKEYGSTKLPMGELTPLKVYRVEPTKDMAEKDHPFIEGAKNYVSTKGFRILGEA